MQNWKNKILAALTPPSEATQLTLHRLKISLIETLGFHEGYQFWLATIAKSNQTNKLQDTIYLYFKTQKTNYNRFCAQESFLLKTIENKQLTQLENWITEQSEQAKLSKLDIYATLLCLHLFLNWTEKYGEVYADWLADHVLDRFASWNKDKSILPNEPLL